MADWSILDRWLSDDDAMRRVARDLRAESNMFKQAYYEARDTGRDPQEVEALRQSMWSTIEKAAEIERALRGI